MWTPESFFTQIQLSGSVVGVLRGPPGRHCRGKRGFAPCAFPASSPTRFGLLVAIKPHTSGGFAGLRVPWGEGIAGPPPGVFERGIIFVAGYFPHIDISASQGRRRCASEVKSCAFRTSTITRIALHFAFSLDPVSMTSSIGTPPACTRINYHLLITTSCPSLGLYDWHDNHRHAGDVQHVN